MNKQKIAIITLTVILIIFVNFYLLDKLSISWQDSLIITERLGYEKGAQDTIKAIFETTEDCNEITITFENHSKHFIESKCFSNLKP